MKKTVFCTVKMKEVIADNTLVALTLMIAESRTEEKDVKVVLNLIHKLTLWKYQIIEKFLLITWLCIKNTSIFAQ